jgi:endogenous inhibitor of DNA gyrase (YacG/DUF329 family)
MTDPDTLSRTKPCPVCGKPAVAAYQPFCSARCKKVDLSRWFLGTYRVETGETEEDAAGADGE